MLNDKVKSMFLKVYATAHELGVSANIPALITEDELHTAAYAGTLGFTVSDYTYAWNSEDLIRYFNDTKTRVQPTSYVVYILDDLTLSSLKVKDREKMDAGVERLRVDICDTCYTIYTLENAVAIRDVNNDSFKTWLNDTSGICNWFAHSYHDDIIPPKDASLIAYYKALSHADLDADLCVMSKLFAEWQRLIAGENIPVKLNVNDNLVVLDQSGVCVKFGYTSDLRLSWDSWDNWNDPKVSEFKECADACRNIVIVEIPTSLDKSPFTVAATPLQWAKLLRINGDIVGFQIDKAYCAVYKNKLEDFINAFNEYCVEWRYLRVVNGAFVRTRTERAQYIFLHIPGNNLDTSALSALYRALDDQDYTSLITAMVSIDKELPAKLNVVLEQMEG